MRRVSLLTETAQECIRIIWGVRILLTAKPQALTHFLFKMINSYPFQLFYSLNIHLVLCYVIHQQSEQHNIHSLDIFGGEVVSAKQDVLFGEWNFMF